LKKFHQSRVDAVKIIGWELYSSMNQGTEARYNYATVNIYKDLADAFANLSVDDARKVWGDKTEDILDKTGKARSLVFNDMFNYAMGIQAKVPEKYLTVSYMKITDQGRYWDMEKKAYMPLHQTVIDAGKMAGWSIWGRSFREDERYDAVAVNGYASLEQFSAGTNYGEAFDKLKASASSADLMEIMKLANATDEIRRIVKSQIWYSIDATTPKK